MAKASSRTPGVTDAPSSTLPTPAPTSDVVLVHGVTEDGGGLEVLRAREQRVERGALRPLERGRPIHGDVVRLRRREGQPLLFDVDTVLDAPQHESAAGPGARATKGPAQVATERYRDNWDRIWPRREGPGSAN